MKPNKKILVFVGLFGIFFVPGIAFAALDAVTFHTNPDTPAPNQPVTITIQSYAVDLSSSSITWYVDKVAAKSGVGETTLQTATKEFGQTVTIDVVIAAQNGARYDKQFLLRPVEVDLLWEADTFVPPFYKGKALPTYKSLVKLTATPRWNALSSNPNGYSYSWTANQTQGLKGGLGKSSVLVPMKFSGTGIPVSVRVGDPTSPGKGASATQNIVAVDPLLMFYEDAPLLGIRFDHALNGNVSTNGTSFRIRAVPYFFSNDDIDNGDLVYSWKKDAQSLTGTELDPGTILLGKEGKSAQQSTMQLSLQNKKRILQQAGAQVTINFSSEQ